MAEELPSVLTDPALRKEEPAETEAPAVSLTLVDHLREAFPVSLPDTSSSNAAQVFGEVTRRQGQQEVIDYLAALVKAQLGEHNELPRTQAEDQSTGPRTPRASRWR